MKKRRPPSRADMTSTIGPPRVSDSQPSVHPLSDPPEVEPGLLVPLFDAVFCFVGIAFPSKWLHVWLRRHKVLEPAQLRFFDIYTLVWIVISPSLLFIAGTRSQPHLLRLLLCVVGWYRVTEILHIAISILLFGRFRKSDEYTVASVRRSLLINVLNYLEIIVLFATIYCAGLAHAIRPLIDNSLDALYFSTVTMTTLGYGDYVPMTGSARVAVVSQVVIGIFFVVLILGRVLALLPQPKRS